MMARKARTQETLPGDEYKRKEIPEIEEPAEELRACRDEIATLNERKRNAENSLITACQAAGISLHRYLDPEGVERKVEVIQKPKATIKRVSKPKEAESPGPTVTVQ